MREGGREGGGREGGREEGGGREGGNSASVLPLQECGSKEGVKGI